MANNRNAAKQAVNNAKQAEKPAKQAPANNGDELLYSLSEVTGGKKYKGETVKVYYVAKKPNRWGNRIAMVEAGDERGFVDVKYLKPVGKMNKADIDRLDKMREAEKNETVFIAAAIDVQRDKAVRINYPGWFAPIWFAKDMVVNTGATLDDENKTPIYEIPTWKVRSSAGADALAALQAKQDHLAKIVAG